MQLSNDELGILFGAGVFIVFIFSLIGLMGVWEKEADKHKTLDSDKKYNNKVAQLRKKP
jgi:hypothetical protein